jgi:two-component system, cell cycle response regulator
MNLGGTLLLIDPSDAMGSLGTRLRMQGFNVVEHRDPEEGVRFALLARPTLVVADLWMPKVSGVQLCRLLGAERTTCEVPVILRGPDGHRNRYWAERAGASAYVLPGRMGDLMRSIRSVLTAGHTPVQLWEDTSDAVGDVRDRIAQYLDQALFDAVVAGEVRALGNVGEFQRLFDLLSQFISRITSYRWMAISTVQPRRLAVHCSPTMAGSVAHEVRAAFGLLEEEPSLLIADDDAYADATGPTPIVRTIELGDRLIGRIALAVREPEHPGDALLVEVIARELAGPIRIASLIEQTQSREERREKLLS